MNPLYNPNQYQAQNGVSPNNPMMQQFGGFQNFQSQFQSFVQNFQQTQNMSPEEYARQLLASGQMSQAEFNQLAAMANLLMRR